MPFKRFPPNLDFCGTWLKPGVNETKRAECRELAFEAKPPKPAERQAETN
jgi:hypothetical protein